MNAPNGREISVSDVMSYLETWGTDVERANVRIMIRTQASNGILTQDDQLALCNNYGDEMERFMWDFRSASRQIMNGQKIDFSV